MQEYRVVAPNVFERVLAGSHRGALNQVVARMPYPEGTTLHVKKGKGLAKRYKLHGGRWVETA